MTTPDLVNRAPQPFVAIHAEVKPQELSAVIDRSFRRLFGFLAERGVPPAGAPFIKYNVVDMERALDIELGVPVAAPVEASGDVHAGTLPTGQYAVTIHHGHFDGLRDATAALLQCAQRLGVEWDASSTPQGERFVSRLETYITDPTKERDPARWQTELAIKTK
jgi:effector-binding domain-containing protein